MENKIKRFLSLALALLMVFSMMPQITLGASAANMSGGETLYLKPNSDWLSGGARFAIYVYGSSGGEAWADMKLADGESDVYVATVPSGSWTNVIFCRMSGSTSANNWNNKWNQTGDLTYDGSKNLCTIPSGQWDCGTNVTWSTYTYVAPTYTYTVAGNSTVVFGTAWDVGNTDNDMVNNGDGTYTKVYTGVPAGTYLFKCARDHDWAVAYPASDYSLTTTATASTVTITLSGTTVTADVACEHVGETSEETVAATCTDAGSVTVTCDECNGTLSTQTIEATGHDYKDGTCTVCGAEDPDYEAPVVGITTIAELQAAIEAAAEGETITVSQILYVNEGETVTLDLQGKTVNLVSIYNSGNLTVKNGTLVGTSADESVIETSAGSLTLETVTASGPRHVIRVKGGDVTINSGTYKVLGTANLTTHAVNVSAGTVTINGGTFVGPKETVGDSGTTVMAQGGTVIINDGNFSGASSGYGTEPVTATEGTITIYGGTYDNDPAGYIAEGYEYNAETGAVVEAAPAISGTFNGALINVENAERTFISAELKNVYATESVVLKLYDANDTLLATTSLVDHGDILGNNFETLSMMVGINCTDSYWNTVWEEGKLSADYVPAYATLYIDGTEMNTKEINMASTNGEAAVNWAEVPGVNPVPAEPAGTITGCLVDLSDSAETFIASEINGLNATESVVIKLYSGETQIATTTLLKSEYFNVSPLGVKIIITGESSSWKTEWAEGMPRADVIPDKVVLYVDDTEMNSAAVPMTSTNGELAVNWAEVPGVNPAPATEIDLSKGSYTITEAGEYVVLGNISTSNTLTINAEGDVTVTLQGVTINAPADTSAISIEKGNVTLISTGKTNNLYGGDNGAGIYVAADASLTIKGDEMLNAAGNDGVDDASGAAGIGGTYANGASGKITIDGATVTALGYGVWASGIGSAGGYADDITIINGADVYAEGGYYANGAGTKLQSDYGKSDPEGGAAIGGGSKDGAGVGTITITDSAVEVYGGSKAAGIGAMFWNNVEAINISGTSNVTAQGGSSSAGIGTSRAGDTGVSANIVISGGTVNATGGDYGAGIGAGYNADSLGNGADASGLPETSITISGGTVTATGGEGGAAIGGGYKTDNVDIDITGGTITATAGALVSGKTVENGGAPAAIGSGANGSGVFENSPAVEVADTATVAVTAYEDGKPAIEGMTNEAVDAAYELTLTPNPNKVYAAQIGDTKYETLAEALTAAADGATIELISGENVISMAGNVIGNKTVTITGTAIVDWTQGNLWIGRGGEGDGKVIFDGANITSSVKKNPASTGIHVSGSKASDNTVNNGVLVIKNSNIELDYLINRNETVVEGNSNLTVYGGCYTHGRDESESGVTGGATATLTIEDGSTVTVVNENGMGVGGESNGVMTVKGTYNANVLNVSAIGTVNVEDGNLNIEGTATNNGAINVSGESTLNITTLTETELKLLHGAVITDSTVGGEAMLYGKVTFRGDNTFTMIYDYGNAYSTEYAEWVVEKGASLTLTEKARYGLGYGDKVTIYGNLEDALTARESLTEADASLFTHGLVAMSNWDVENSFTVEDAYVIIGSNNSFGNSSSSSHVGTYTFSFDNVVLDGSRITFYSANSQSTFNFTDSDVKIGTFMTRDADSVFTLTNTKLVSTTTTNGTDEGNYHAGTLVLNNSSLSYAAPLVMENGTLTLGAGSSLTAPSITGAGKIVIDAADLSAGAAPIVGDASTFTGTIEVINNSRLIAEVNEDGQITLIEKSLEGEGTESDPYLITCLEDLILFRDTVNTYTSDGSNQYKNKFVKLTADIDLAGINWKPIGTNSVGDHMAFLGTFDGDGHTISNLYINGDGGHLGFFARVGSYGEDVTPTVKNLKFVNVDVSSNTTTSHTGSYVGGVIANAGGNSVVSNVTVSGDVYVAGYGYVGGIVGHGYPDLTNCHVNANEGSYLHCYYWCGGGIIGYAGEGGTPITDCSVSGLDIWSAYGGAAAVAGMLQDGNTMTNVSASDVKITSASDYVMGYVAGNGEASTLTNVTATNVTATANGKEITSTDAVAKIGNVAYFDLASAFAAAQDGDTVTILRAGTYTLSTSGKDITITGAVDGVVFDNIGAKNMGGANVTFNNVTFDYLPNTNYTGLQHSGNLVYNNCTFDGTVFLYGASETFNDCTFNVEGDAYNVWTYGAKVVKFEGCTFNSTGKSVLVYNEGACATDLTVTDCKFIASSSFDGKAAIEISGEHLNAEEDGYHKVNIYGETTAEGFAAGSVSGNTLWNDKYAAYESYVYVDGELVWPVPQPAADLSYAGYVDVTGEAGTESYRESIKVDMYNVYAESSLVVELWSGETKLSTTTLRETDRDDETAELYPVDADSFTANIIVSGRLAGSWDTEWHVVPAVDNIPDTIKVYADGELVDTWNEGFINDTEKAEYLALTGVYKSIIATDESGNVTYYTSLDDLFAADFGNDEVNVELLENVSTDKQVNTTESQACYNFVTNVEGGASVTFAYANDWNSVRHMSIGTGVTLNTKHLYVYGGVFDVYGTVTTDYAYTASSAVTVKDGGVLNATTGDATVQVKNNSWLEVYGTVNAGTVNVWNDGPRGSHLIVSGENAQLDADHIHAWNGGDGSVVNEIIVKDGATLTAAVMQADRGATVTVDAATLTAETLTLGYEGNVGTLTVQNGGVVTNGAILNSVGSTVTGPEGMNVTTELEGKIVGYENGVYSVVDDPAYGMVAMIGENYYATVAEAVEAAVAGDTIVLIADAEEELLVLLEGVTLDLNGNDVTVSNYVGIFATNHVIDSVGGGLLKGTENVMIDDENKALPIWDDTNKGYAFADLDMFHEMFGEKTTNSVEYIFLPELDPAEYALIAQGAEVSGVTLKVEVSWMRTDAEGDTMSSSVTFVYTNELMEAFVNAINPETGAFGGAFNLRLSGTEGKTLAFKVYFESDTGAILECN